MSGGCFFRFTQSIAANAGWLVQRSSLNQVQAQWGTGAATVSATLGIVGIERLPVIAVCMVHNGAQGVVHIPGVGTSAATAGALAINVASQVFIAGGTATNTAAGSDAFLAGGSHPGAYTTADVDTWWNTIAVPDMRAGREITPFRSVAGTDFWWRASDAWERWAEGTWPEAIGGGAAAQMTRTGAPERVAVYPGF
jgi:hypothetical protein